MGKFELRKYQRDAVDAGLECLLNNNKGIAVLPCGAGKSLIAAKVAEELDKPIVILQPSKELLMQNYQKFISFGGVASIYCASLKDKTIDKEDYTVMPDGTLKRCREISKVTFATIGSIKKETALLKRAGLQHLIIDETHIAMKHKTGGKDTQLRTFIKDLKIKSVLGLTATPVHLVNTQDGAKLNMMNRTQATMFRQIIHVTQISELVENNYWSPLIYENQLTQTSMLELNTTGSDYTELSQQLFYQENSLHSRILERIKELREEGRKRILVFMPSVQEAQDLYEENTDDFAIVHSKMTMKKRNYMISEFREGKRPVAVNCNILATGFDEPEIDAVIFARPTNSMAIYYQALGRGVRIHPDKKDCLIIDFSGSLDLFGRLEDIKFEDLNYYGWAMTSGNKKVVTGFPMDNLPTIEQVINKAKEKHYNIDGEDKTMKMSFGKHKGKTLHRIHVEDRGYLKWIVSPEFKPFNKLAKKLKKEAEEELNKFML